MPHLHSREISTASILDIICGAYARMSNAIEHTCVQSWHSRCYEELMLRTAAEQLRYISIRFPTCERDVSDDLVGC